MELKVLGCYGRLTPREAAPGFLVDGQLLIDAGTLGSALDESELAGVRWLLLSHCHLDHVKELPALALARHDAKLPPLELAALPETLDELRKHLFNGVVWPDFSRLGDPPALAFHPLAPGRAETLGPYRVAAYELNHPIRCAGFLLDSPDCALAYVSDTGPTDAIWQAAAENPRIRTVIVDVLFPDRFGEHAAHIGHYTPAAAAADLRKIGRDVHALAVHMHPKYVAEIRHDLARHGLRAELAEQAATYVLSEDEPPAKRAGRRDDWAERLDLATAGKVREPPFDTPVTEPMVLPTTVATAWTMAPERQNQPDFLVVVYGENLGRRYEVGVAPVSIGRSNENSIQLADDNVSRTHCRLVAHRHGVLLYDQNSTNGTYVDGKAVTAHILRDGERVTVGRNIFKYLSGANVEHAYHEEIYRLMTTDILSGAHNRGFFERELVREMRRFFRYSRPVSLAMIDLDRFKNINLEYGYLAGDRVLAQFGPLLNREIRVEDVLCRWSGEQFAILMPEMSEAAAIEAVEHLRQAIAEARFVFEGDKKAASVSVTAAIGVAEARPDMNVPRDLVDVVEQRLAEAQQSGGNVVCPAPPSQKPA